MFLLRAIVGLALITVGIVGLAEAFDNPKAIVLTFVAVPLGLFVMGYISRYAPVKARAEDLTEELRIRASRHFGLRCRVMGLVALLLGSGTLWVVIHTGAWSTNWEATAGSVMFCVLGIYYLVKGRKAESWYREAVLRADPRVAEMLSSSKDLER